MNQRAFTHTLKACTASLVALCFFSMQSVSAQDDTSPGWPDRTTLVMGLGTMSFIGLPEEISSPLNISGVYEINHYLSIGRSFAIQGGLGFTFGRFMLDGQFVKTGNDEIQIHPVDDGYSQNYYNITSLSVPLTAFVKWSEKEDSYFNFLGLGIRNNFVLSGQHKYHFQGEKHTTDIRPFIHNYKPAAIIQLGFMAKSREVSSFLHTYSLEIGIDLLPLDDGNVRTITGGFRIGI